MNSACLSWDTGLQVLEIELSQPKKEQGLYFQYTVVSHYPQTSGFLEVEPGSRKSLRTWSFSPTHLCLALCVCFILLYLQIVFLFFTHIAGAPTTQMCLPVPQFQAHLTLTGCLWNPDPLPGKTIWLAQLGSCVHPSPNQLSWVELCSTNVTLMSQPTGLWN